MAVPPKTDAAFLREVDEELRRDQMEVALRRYGIAALAAVILLVLAFGGWQLWQSHQHQVAAEEGEALGKAFDDLGGGHPEAATTALTKLNDSAVPGYRALARMTEADTLLQKQNLKGAAALFAQIAADSSVGQPLRDLALIRQTNAEFDTLKPEVVVSRLRGLAAKDSPFFPSAAEMVAISYLRMGKRDLAGTLFAQIGKAEGVPPTLQQRTVQMAGVLGVDAVTQPTDQSEGKKSK